MQNTVESAATCFANGRLIRKVMGAAIGTLLFCMHAGCAPRQSQLSTLVHSKIQQAALKDLEHDRSMTTSAPSEVVDALQSLIPYQMVGPGNIANPQYVVSLFVAGDWAEIRINTNVSPAQFWFDGSIYQASVDCDFPTKADNVLSGRRANQGIGETL